MADEEILELEEVRVMTRTDTDEERDDREDDSASGNESSSSSEYSSEISSSSKHSRSSMSVLQAIWLSLKAIAIWGLIKTLISLAIYIYDIISKYIISLKLDS